MTERTREIGVRMAVGVLSVFGPSALASALSLPIEPSADALLIALIISSGIGAVFGLVPAWRAASFDPIAAPGRQ